MHLPIQVIDSSDIAQDANQAAKAGVGSGDQDDSGKASTNTRKSHVQHTQRTVKHKQAFTLS